MEEGKKKRSIGLRVIAALGSLRLPRWVALLAPSRAREGRCGDRGVLEVIAVFCLHVGIIHVRREAVIKVHLLLAEEAHCLLGAAGPSGFPEEPLLLHRHERVQALATPVGLAATIALMHVGHSLDVPAGANWTTLVVAGAHIQVTRLVKSILRETERRRFNAQIQANSTEAPIAQARRL